MKKYLLAILLVTLSQLSFAQSGDEEHVMTALEQLRTAMISGERAALEKIASAKLSYGHSSGLVENKQEFVEHIASGKSDFVTIDLTEQTITMARNVAIVRHVLSATTNDNNKPGTVKLKVMLVWQKEKGHWKLLARQAVKVP
jgi:hypothetical protein